VFFLFSCSLSFPEHPNDWHGEALPACTVRVLHLMEALSQTAKHPKNSIKHRKAFALSLLLLLVVIKQYENTPD